MEEAKLRDIITIIILGGLLVLSFFLLKPILMSIAMGIVLAFVFLPLYNWVFSITNMKNLSAGIVCIFVILLIVLPIWFLTPIFIEQSFKIYVGSQQLDVVTPLKKVFPSIFASENFSNEVGSILHSFIMKTTNGLVNALSNFILNFPTFAMQLLVVFFTFFFVLRDKEILVEYIKSIMPFSKDVERKLFEHSSRITSAVLYGQVVVGILQGLIIGVGFFIFGVPNALFLTLMAAVGGIIPMVGPVFVWVPVVAYLLISGDNSSAVVGVTLFGIVASSIDNILRPLIVSQKTKIHTSIVLIGMIGGLFLFGILGLILGPLILSYLLAVLEIYKTKKNP